MAQDTKAAFRKFINQTAWRPGVKVEAAFKAGKFDVGVMAQAEVGQNPHLPEIYAKCPGDKKDGIADRILAMFSVSKGCIVKDANNEHWKHLPNNAKAVFERIFYGKEPLGISITIWLQPPHSPQIAIMQWAGPRVHAVHAFNAHKPPLWQYQNSEGEMVCSLKDTPEISDFQKGMYVMKRGKSTTHYGFPKQTEYLTPHDLGLTISILVVRDHQLARKLAQAFALVPHRAFAWKVPKLEMEGREQEAKILQGLYHVFVRCMPDNKGNVLPSPWTIRRSWTLSWA